LSETDLEVAFKALSEAEFKLLPVEMRLDYLNREAASVRAKTERLWQRFKQGKPPLVGC
jgi:DNA phosphorothioation-dependent restriction protein DptG